MKSLCALLVLMSISLTAVAEQIDSAALAKSIGQTLQAEVKINKIRATFNPLDMYINLLDNCEIKRIFFTVNNEHKIACDLIVYEGVNRVRLEYCDSQTIKISDGYIYY